MTESLQSRFGLLNPLRPRLERRSRPIEVTASGRDKPGCSPEGNRLYPTATRVRGPFRTGTVALPGSQCRSRAAPSSTWT